MSKPIETSSYSSSLSRFVQCYIYLSLLQWIQDIIFAYVFFLLICVYTFLSHYRHIICWLYFCIALSDDLLFLLWFNYTRILSPSALLSSSHTFLGSNIFSFFFLHSHRFFLAALIRLFLAGIVAQSEDGEHLANGILCLLHVCEMTNGLLVYCVKMW